MSSTRLAAAIGVMVAAAGASPARAGLILDSSRVLTPPTYTSEVIAVPAGGFHNPINVIVDIFATGTGFVGKALFEVQLDVVDTGGGSPDLIRHLTFNGWFFGNHSGPREFRPGLQAGALNLAAVGQSTLTLEVANFQATQIGPAKPAATPEPSTLIGGIVAALVGVGYHRWRLGAA